MDKKWEMIIIGGGPAGLAAAVYCGRALRKTLVLEKKIFGGQIVLADIIENYPGFVEPQVPIDLMENFIQQAKRYGVHMENEEVTKISKGENGWEVSISEEILFSHSLIYAAGSEHRFLGVPGEKELLGRGLSVCATCDAPFFTDRRVAVIGGGDTALVEALHLTKFAAEVTVIHRRDALRAERILQERAFTNEKIRFFWNCEVKGFLGEQRLQALRVLNKEKGEISELEFDGAFMAIGTIPNTSLLEGLVELDEGGYAVTDISLSTKAQGLFVAGEVIRGNRRQVSISAGMGVQAALSCEEYLESLSF